MIRNFSFVIKDRLAGCGASGAQEFVEEDLESLREKGIAALVSLTEDPIDPEVMRNAGFDFLHLPVADFHPPTLGQIRKFVEFVREHIEKRKPQPVAVHCYAGRGRTGTMLACYLVSTGVKAAEAVRTLRRLRPGSVETPEQERAVVNFQAWLQEMGQWKGAGAVRRRPRKASRPKTGEPKSPDAARSRKSRRPRKSARKTPPGGSTPFDQSDSADDLT